jgi:hypothetical protein
MKTYPIPLNLLQDIVNNLQEQPWAKVNNLMVAINRVVAAIDQPIELPKSNGKEEQVGANE